MQQGIRIRTVILLWLLLLGVSGIQAQSAGDIDTLSQWRVNHTVGEPQYMHYSYYKYYISGTEIIDTLLYYRVFSSGYWRINNYPPNYFNGYHAPLREEGNKWYTVNDNNEDVLLYDFTLGIGDTVHSYANSMGMGEIITITGIDTIMIDGEPKKKLYLSVEFGAEYIIEDVGANTGIWESLTWFENHSILHCYARDFVPLWINPESGSCNLAVNIDEQVVETIMSVYPNPFTTTTTIECELTEPSNVQLTIYNAIGEVVYRAEDRLMAVGRNTFKWNPENLSEGLYYAVLRSGKGVSVVKMVKR